MPHLRRINTTLIQMFNRQVPLSTIHIAVVICGNRLNEGLLLLKSAVIFSHSHLVLHVFTEDELKQAIEDEELLRDVDSVIYLDTDSFFLAPVEAAWKQFSNFGPQHIFGIAPNLEITYSKLAIPHCSSEGLNSGVLFMNLTRIRESNWLVSMQETLKNNRSILMFGDQDLVNIYCFFNPGATYIMDCVWNYRGRFCETDKRCDDALTTGINILHAYDRKARDVKEPHLAQVFKAFEEYNLSKHSPQDLYDSIVNNIKPFSKTKCGERSHIFTRHLVNYIHNFKVETV